MLRLPSLAAVHAVAASLAAAPLGAQTAKPDPAPGVPQAGESYVIRGTCRLVVDGQVLVDRHGDCPIWMANDGTGTFWINTDRDTYLGAYFAEIEPQGDGTGWGYWNGESGATHAQAALGEDFRMGAGGCWSNARAAICAAR